MVFLETSFFTVAEWMGKVRKFHCVEFETEEYNVLMNFKKSQHLLLEKFPNISQSNRIMIPRFIFSSYQLVFDPVSSIPHPISTFCFFLNKYQMSYSFVNM
jgi:hypothetical protein